jgi:hypothetical protein
MLTIEPSMLTYLEPTMAGPEQEQPPDPPEKSLFRNDFVLPSPTDSPESYRTIWIYKGVDSLQMCSTKTQNMPYVDGISNLYPALMGENTRLNRLHEDNASDNPTTIYTNILHPKIGLQMYAQMDEPSDINLC